MCDCYCDVMNQSLCRAASCPEPTSDCCGYPVKPLECLKYTPPPGRVVRRNMNYKTISIRVIAILFLEIFVVATPVVLPRAQATDPPPTATFTEWDTTARVPGIPTGGDFNPHVIQVDHTGITGFPAGSVWSVVDNPLCDLVNLDPATNVYTHWATLGGGSTEGIAVNTGNGDVWGTVIGPGVGAIPATGFADVAPVYVKLGGTNNFILYKSPNAVRGIAVSGVDPFFAEISAGNIVHLTEATGAATKWFIGAFTSPSYVAIASDGKVYFTETGSNLIGRLDPLANATNIREWAVPTPSSHPLGIFIDPSGNVWVTESSSNRVAKLDPVGNTITEFPKANATSPNQIAVSSAGQAFYTDSLANTINVLTPFGNETATPVAPADRSVTPMSASLPTINATITPTVGVITPVVTTVSGSDPSDTVRFPIPTPSSDPVGMSDVVVVSTTLSNGTIVTTNTIYFDEHFEAPFFSFHGKIGCLVSKIIKTPPPPGGIKVSKFFTDTSLNPLPKDQNGNPKVDVVLAKGVVQSTNPGEIIAWVNVTNTGSSRFQSVKLNETLPVDWVVSPKWLPAQGAIHVFFANTTSLATNPEITDPATITVTTGNPETVILAIPSLNATAIGHPLMPGQTILLGVKLDYGLDKTSQSASTFPRNYTDTASAAAWTQPLFTGTEATGTASGFFVAFAKVLGDVNGDFKVDIIDAGMAMRAFGSRPGDPNWIASADFNNNGIIDIIDFGIVVSNFGTSS